MKASPAGYGLKVGRHLKYAREGGIGMKIFLDARFNSKELAECCQGAASPCQAFGFKCQFGYDDGNDEICAKVTTDMWEAIVDNDAKE